MKPLNEKTEDRISTWLAGRTEPFRAIEVAEMLGLPTENMTDAVMTQIVIALLKLGCEQIKFRPLYGYRFVTGYLPPRRIRSTPQKNPLIRSTQEQPSPFISDDDLCPEVAAKWQSDFAELGRQAREAAPSSQKRFASSVPTDPASHSARTRRHRPLLPRAGVLVLLARRPFPQRPLPGSSGFAPSLRPATPARSQDPARPFF